MDLYWSVTCSYPSPKPPSPRLHSSKWGEWLAGQQVRLPLCLQPLSLLALPPGSHLLSDLRLYWILMRVRNLLCDCFIVCCNVVMVEMRYTMDMVCSGYPRTTPLPLQLSSVGEFPSQRLIPNAGMVEVFYSKLQSFLVFKQEKYLRRILTYLWESVERLHCFIYFLIAVHGILTN